MTGSVSLSTPARLSWISIFVALVCLSGGVLLLSKLVHMGTIISFAGIFFVSLDLFLALSLLRMLFARERLTVTSGSVMPNERSGLHLPLADLIEVRVLDDPVYLSNEWRLSFWGWGAGRLLLTTTHGVTAFGRSLSAQQAEASLHRIRRFASDCGVVASGSSQHLTFRHHA